MEEYGAKVLTAGSTPEQISVGRTDKGIFVLCMNATSANKENRWTMDFCIAIHKAFDCIEEELEKDVSGTPAALITISASPKFFSNGIDPTYFTSPPDWLDINQFNDLIMSAFVRPILLPIPTICVINGHSYGAGMMFSLGHDHRIQRKDRGFQCAIEVAIGIPTPPAELTLFRHSMSASAFYETVNSAKKWTGDDAKLAGIVQASVPAEQLVSEGLKSAKELSKLAVNRESMKYFKLQTKGFVVEEVLMHLFPEGKATSEKAPLPSRLQQHVDDIVVGKSLQKTWGVEHGRRMQSKM